jgi:hypothetical protein
MRRRDLLRGIAALPVVARAPVLAQPASAATGLLTQLLLLKYVEAEFYRQGNARNLLGGAEAAYLAQIGEHKQAHVAALTQALTAPPLNAAPPPAPAVRFDQAYTSREAYLETAYGLEDALFRFYLGLPAMTIAETIDVRFELGGMVATDDRGLAVLGALTGKPTVGGVLMDPNVTPLQAEGLMAAFQPYLADAASMADTAAATD